MTLVNTETGEITDDLTPMEKSALTHAEAAIEQGVAQVGKALAEIRDQRLYRAEFPTFEAYCRERWGMVRSTVNRKIVAAEVAQILEPIGSKPDSPTAPIPEAQARELAPLRNEPQVVRDIYADVQRETQGKPTASAIRTTVKRHLAVAAPVPVQDEAFWNEAAEKATESGWLAKREAERPYSLALTRLTRLASDVMATTISPLDLAANVPASHADSLPQIETAARWLNTFIEAHKESE